MQNCVSAFGNSDELEDLVLTVIDEHFQSNGWTVSSLQFDGLHVEHRASDVCDERTGKWVQLEAAIRGAEQAIESKLGYKIKLKEKELFEAPPPLTSVE